MLVAPSAEEVVEADLEQVRRRRIARDVAAELGRAAALGAVGAHDHRQRVPAHQRGEPLLQGQVAGERRLLGERDRVHVRRDQRRLPVDAAAARVGEQRIEQEAGARRAVGGGERIERLAPFGGLGRIGIVAAAGENGADVAGEREVGHASILRGGSGLAPAASNRRRGLTAARTRTGTSSPRSRAD